MKRNVLGKAIFHKKKTNISAHDISVVPREHKIQHTNIFFTLAHSISGFSHVSLECVGFCGMWGQSQGWHQTADQHFLLLTNFVFPTEASTQLIYPKHSHSPGSFCSVVVVLLYCTAPLKQGSRRSHNLQTYHWTNHLAASSSSS